MFKISETQLSVLKQTARSSFEERMTLHLFNFARHHCEAIGKDVVRESVRLGLDRAGKYGLTQMGPVRCFVELMYMLGSDFDTDPLLWWASETLTSPGLPDQMHRGECLYGHAQNYLELVIGANGCYAKSAHQRAVLLFSAPPQIATTDSLIGWLPERFMNIYPEKCSYVGQRALIDFVRHSIEKSTEGGLTKPCDIALLISMMFLLGHGIAHDPLFPWIASFFKRKIVHTNLTSWLEQRLRVDAKLVFDDIAED